MLFFDKINYKKNHLWFALSCATITNQRYKRPGLIERGSYSISDSTIRIRFLGRLYLYLGRRYLYLEKISVFIKLCLSLSLFFLSMNILDAAVSDEDFFCITEEKEIREIILSSFFSICLSLTFSPLKLFRRLLHPMTISRTMTSVYWRRRRVVALSPAPASPPSECWMPGALG